jgi:hypothetical protein
MNKPKDQSWLIIRFRELRKGWWVFLVTLIFMGISMKLFGTGCIFAGMTGIPCPGCGITRSMLALIRFDLVTSLQFYPMLLPCGVGLTAYFIAWMRNTSGSKRWSKFLAGMGIAIVIVYVVRMLLFFPHTPPMNYHHQAVLPQAADHIKEWVLERGFLD